MSKIAIIGWYGTETIGDRAILAGLLDCLNSAYPGCTIKLGSLYPMLSERTLVDDWEFFKDCSGNPDLNIKLFDSQDVSQLKNNIKSSDIVCIGGGPLMDIKEMNLLKYAFQYAKRHKIKTAILGCGWGPIKTQECTSIARTLMQLSDLTIFRDGISFSQAMEVGTKSNEIYSAVDPAFFACKYFITTQKEKSSSDFIAVNYRDANLGGQYLNNSSLVQTLTAVTMEIRKASPLPIRFVPMHTFRIGGDDRELLDNISKSAYIDNINVIQTPLSLSQVMSCYYNSAFCVGMRFHSVLMQTSLNGNNFILDYTDPCKGKTIGMLREIQADEFYSQNRYFSLSSGLPFTGTSFDLTNTDKFSFPWDKIEKCHNLYIEKIRSI